MKVFFFSSWKTKKYINHIQTEALVGCIAEKWHILIQIVFSTVLWANDVIVEFNFKGLSMMCDFPKHCLDEYKFCVFN